MHVTYALQKLIWKYFFSGCVPEETHIDADNDWKTTRSSKGKTDICLCSNCQMISLGFRFSDEVRVRQQRLRGKEE